MSLEAFQDFLDQFGEDPAKWPESLRRAAETLLARDAAARAAFAEARINGAGLRRRFVKAPTRLLQTIDRRVRDIAEAERPRSAVANGRP
ncbi:MAG TPA: hypothetical protein VHA35_09630 [Dongiaceae bacterium]|nr:hypothetical protein [Dongiaceae bacterium]